VNHLQGVKGRGSMRVSFRARAGGRCLCLCLCRGRSRLRGTGPGPGPVQARNRAGGVERGVGCGEGWDGSFQEEARRVAGLAKRGSVAGDGSSFGRKAKNTEKRCDIHSFRMLEDSVGGQEGKSGEGLW
jgi:hypothetical protein